MQPTTLASVLFPPLPLGPSFPMCLPSLPPSFALCRLPSSSTPFALFIFGYLSPVRRYVLCPELLFILISRAFCFSVVSGLRRKYKIIMIIMSHFARNNTVGAGIRRGSRAIRRANNVGRRGLTISRTHVVFFVRTLLSLSISTSPSRCPSPFNGTFFFHSRVRLRSSYALCFMFLHS